VGVLGGPEDKALTTRENPRPELVAAQVLSKYTHGEVGLFMLAMGTIMYFYEHEPDTLSPLLSQILDRFIHL